MYSGRLRVANLFLRRTYSQVKSTGPPKSSAPKEPVVSNVTGLSSKCVKPVKEPVGPGASPSGVYKVPEYFCFNRFSYMEAEVEMAKYRCQQPKAPRKQ